MIFRQRKRAYEIMKEFEDLLCDLVRNRPRKNEKRSESPEDDLVVHMLERALDEGKMDESQFRANLKITFLTAHENVQQLLNSTFWELGKNQASLLPQPAKVQTLTFLIGCSGQAPGRSSKNRCYRPNSRDRQQPPVLDSSCLRTAASLPPGFTTDKPRDSPSSCARR